MDGRDGWLISACGIFPGCAGAGPTLTTQWYLRKWGNYRQGEHPGLLTQSFERKHCGLRMFSDMGHRNPALRRAHEASLIPCGSPHTPAEPSGDGRLAGHWTSRGSLSSDGEKCFARPSSFIWTYVKGTVIFPFACCYLSGDQIRPTSIWITHK